MWTEGINNLCQNHPSIIDIIQFLHVFCKEPQGPGFPEGANKKKHFPNLQQSCRWWFQSMKSIGQNGCPVTRGERFTHLPIIAFVILVWEHSHKWVPWGKTLHKVEITFWSNEQNHLLFNIQITWLKDIHPRNLTWNLKIMVSKSSFLFQGLKNFQVPG